MKFILCASSSEELLEHNIIRGKLFQNERMFEVEFAQGRDIPPDYLIKIEKILQGWLDSCDKTLTYVENQVEAANNEKAKCLQNKLRVEKEITNMRKTIKAQIIEHDEAMSIETHDNTSSTSQDARRKPCRPKSNRTGSVKYPK
ncbi:COP9 signalosome complex subunit 7-like [Teleopsis dalmanni]|uniref:COP9 signalosome complex subunit 7-like n=1 Tax=Teleopsis dalmanni TaxID=139649 RepID=UPI0018CEAC85|nr:COP9 signalosome complex subunit 7-like [Teleopsis dalmanni]